MADNNNASTVMVALVAILVIIAIGFIVLQVLPAQDDGNDIEVDLDGLGGSDGSMNSTQ